MNATHETTSEIHPGVTRFMAREGGGRTLGLEPVPGVKVSVIPNAGENNEAAAAVANALLDNARAETLFDGKLAMKDNEIASLRAELSEARRQTAIARAALPPKSPARLLGPGYVRFSPRGEVWLLGNREKGWASFGFLFSGWDELFRRWDGRVTEYGVDEHGPWWKVEPGPAVVR